MTSSQPRVRRNEWGSLLVPPLGAWQPHLNVSIVMPAYGAHRTLPYVLAGLSAQTYPSHLVELIVVDDGAHAGQEPLELPEVRPDNARIVRVEQGWGRANACHLGAGLAEGDVIHWLDADMLPGREHVEAQLRWHHEIDYAVVLGNKWFVDPAAARRRHAGRGARRRGRGPDGGVLPGRRARAARVGRAVLRALRRPAHHRPARLRMHVGATASLTRDLYLDSGGMDTTLRLGEDIALGYRLGEAGAVFVPDREARSWHLGRTHVMNRRDEVNDYNDCFLSDRLPELRNKRRAGRLYAVPYLEVVLDTAACATARWSPPSTPSSSGTLPDLHGHAGRPLERPRRHPHPPARRPDARHPPGPGVVRRRPARPPGRVPARGPVPGDVPDDPRERRLGADPQDRRPAAAQPRAHPPRAAARADARRHDRPRRAHRRGVPRPPRDQAGRVPRRRPRRAVRRLDVRRRRGRLLALERGAPRRGCRARPARPRTRPPPGTTTTSRSRPAPSAEAARTRSRSGHRAGARRRSRRRLPPPPDRCPRPRLRTASRPCWAAGDRRCPSPTPRWSRSAAWSRRPSAGSSSSSARAAAAPARCPAPCRPSACTCRSPRWSPTRPTPRASASRSGSSTSTPSCSSAATSRSPTPGRRPGSRPASSANIERLRTRLHDWLEEQFAEAPELVVKDPRLAWFLGLWRSAALRCEATPAYVTMLRPVTEVVGSKQRYYSTRFGEIDRTAAWVNMMLHTERATRGSQRAFVRYGDLLTDWTIPLFGIGQRFDLFAVKSRLGQRHPRGARVHRPGAAPRPAHLGRHRGADPAARHRRGELAAPRQARRRRAATAPTCTRPLDELRAAYAEIYDEAEAIASSTALAARREGYADGAPAARRWTLRRRGADRIPHGVRAMVPASARRGLRRAIGRER